LSALGPNLPAYIFIGLFFFAGLTSFFIGVFILAFRASGSDVKTLAVQTTQLVQKGLAEDMVGLIGNASDLLDAMNQLLRTARGVGMFLTMLGFALMATACWFAIKIIG
jgi:hypothetical protein